MKIIPLIALLLGLTLSIDGCSYYHEQQEAYSKANNGPELVVDPPLSTQKVSNAYIIPQDEKMPASVDAPPPPGSIIDPGSTTYKVKT